MTNKNILIVSPEPWDHINVSKHHYARTLARKGNKVFFLGPPTDNYSIDKNVYDNLSILYYKKFLPGLSIAPRWFRQWQIRRKLQILESIAETAFDIIWSFDNSVFFDFSAISDNKIKICHIVDLNQDFQFELAASTADICIGVSQRIVTKLSSFNSNSFFINHGVEIHERPQNKPVTLPGDRAIKALYLGNLSIPSLDWETLLDCALDLGHIDFVFVGSNQDDFDLSKNSTHLHKKQLWELPNAHFMEAIPSEMIPHYAEAADLLLICYHEKYHKNQAVNPHKTLEYLLSGKVIVATLTEEYISHGDLIAMSHSNSEYPSLLQEVTNKLEYYNNKDVVSARKTLALANSYNKQVEKIEQLIKVHAS